MTTRFTVFEHNCHRCRFWIDNGEGRAQSGRCAAPTTDHTMPAPSVAQRWIDHHRVECPDFDYVPPKRTLLQRIVRLFVVP